MEPEIPEGKIAGWKLPEIGDTMLGPDGQQLKVLEVHDRGRFVLAIHHDPQRNKYVVTHWDKPKEA